MSTTFAASTGRSWEPLHSVVVSVHPHQEGLSDQREQSRKVRPYHLFVGAIRSHFVSQEKACMCSDYIGYQITFSFTGEGWHAFRLYRLSDHILFFRGRLACVQII